MDYDLMFVGGIIAVVISIFPLLNAFSHGDRPHVWAVLAIAGLGLVLVVFANQPDAYSLETAPEVFGRVFNRFK